MEHIKNIAFGTRSDVRLEDLRKWHRLEAVCQACRHRTILDPARLLSRWPGHSRLVNLEAKLHCSACRNGNGNRLNVARLVRD